MAVKFICDYCGKQEETEYDHYDGHYSSLGVLEIKEDDTYKVYVLCGYYGEEDSCFRKFADENNIIQLFGRFERK